MIGSQRLILRQAQVRTVEACFSTPCNRKPLPDPKVLLVLRFICQEHRRGDNIGRASRLKVPSWLHDDGLTGTMSEGEICTTDIYSASINRLSTSLIAHSTNSILIVVQYHPFRPQSTHPSNRHPRLRSIYPTTTWQRSRVPDPRCTDNRKRFPTPHDSLLQCLLPDGIYGCTLGLGQAIAPLFQQCPH